MHFDKKEARSVYKIVCITILLLFLYLLSLPLISPFMSRILPDIWQCAYHAGTGKPCPFCGITRDISNLLMGNTENADRNLLSIYCLFLIFFEISFRSIILIFKKFKNVYLIYSDIVIHIIMYSVLTVYAVIMLNQ